MKLSKLTCDVIAAICFRHMGSTNRTHSTLLSKVSLTRLLLFSSLPLLGIISTTGVVAVPRHLVREACFETTLFTRHHRLVIAPLMNLTVFAVGTKTVSKFWMFANGGQKGVFLVSIRGVSFSCEV